MLRSVKSVPSSKALKSRHNNTKTKKVQKKKTPLKRKSITPRFITTAHMSTQTQEKPAKFVFDPQHEKLFDDSLVEQAKRLEAGETAQDIGKEQALEFRTYPAREWTLRDTIAIAPHIIKLLDPQQSAFAQFAAHRITAVRKQLQIAELNRLEKESTEATITEDPEAQAKKKVERENFLKMFTIDLIPVNDLIRAQMQVVLSVTQYVTYAYQKHCKSVFIIDQQDQQDVVNGIVHQTGTPMQKVLDRFLDDLEHEQHLTFYRIHYQNNLNKLTASLLPGENALDKVIEQSDLLDTNMMRNIFYNRHMFATSTSMKEALREGFTQHNVLVDSTKLPLNDPTNTSKANVINQILESAHIQITKDAGLDVPLGHYLIETEMALGVRYPKAPKHELDIKSRYRLARISKMPQDPAVAHDFATLVAATAHTKKLQLKAQGGEEAEKVPEGTIIQDAADSAEYINEVEELPVLLPEELYLVPVQRSERAAFFQQYPEMHTMWLIYNKIVEEAQKVEKHGANLAELDAYQAKFKDEPEKLQQIQETRNRVMAKYENAQAAIQLLDQQYKEKATIFRQNTPEIGWDDSEKRAEDLDATTEPEEDGAVKK